jgi:hypothetical protein
MSRERVSCRRLVCAGLVAGLLLTMAAPANASTLWEIYTYGNGELLTSAFQGIALFASNGLQSALKMAALVALLAALFASIPAVLGGQQALLAVPYTALTAGIVGILCSPSFRVQVAIIDRVALSQTVVDGVPLPIAAIGYISSAFGERLAEKVEEAIYPVDYYGKFTESGLGWGPRVVQTTLGVNLLDLSLATDLDAYIRLCVIPDVQDGTKSVDQIVKTTTAEAMLGGTNPAIPILLPSQCNGDGLPSGCTPAPPDQRCPDAVTQSILPRLGQASVDPALLALIAQQIGKSNPSDVLPSIEETVSDILGIQQDAVELLTLRFAANQLMPSIQANAALGGQNGILTAWAISAAEAQQTASWLTAGLLLQQVLPFFHATLEFLFYGFLLFGIPLMIVMPRIFPQVMGNALWLQLWPLAYVFANRILYSQALKAGLYSTQMNWGMSVAATQPITTTFNYAYAASGFPVAVGVLLLGGMIFGGSYAMTKVVQHAPWQVGAGMGTEAAMGNVSAGNVSLEQATLAPHTEVVGRDVLGNPAALETVGPRAHPVSATSTGPLGRSLAVGTGSATVLDLESPDRVRLTLSEQGVAVQDPYLTYEVAQQEAVRSSAAAGTALSSATRSEASASATVSQQTAEAYQRLTSLSTSTGDTRASGLAQAVQRSSSRNVEYALRQAIGDQQVHSELDARGVTGDLSFGLKALGSGIGGSLQVQARGSDGRSHTFALTQDQARSFAEHFARSTSRDETWRHSMAEAESYLRSHGDSFNLGESVSAVRSAATSRQQAEELRTSAEQSQQVARALAQNREGDMVRAAWERWGYAARYGDLLSQRRTDLHPEGRAHVAEFFAHYRDTLLSPDPAAAAERGLLAMEANRQFPQDQGVMMRTREEIATEKAQLETASSTLTRPTSEALPYQLKEQEAAEPPGSPGPVAKDVDQHLHPGASAAAPHRSPATPRDDHGENPGGYPVPPLSTMQSTQQQMQRDSAPRETGTLARDAALGSLQSYKNALDTVVDTHHATPFWKIAAKGTAEFITGTVTGLLGDSSKTPPERPKIP